MFPDEAVVAGLAQLQGKLPDLAPVFGPEKVGQYLSLPATVTHISDSSVLQLLRLPASVPGARFRLSEERPPGGLVTLTSAQHRVSLTFRQHRRCVREPSTGDRVCLLRPCLLTHGQHQRVHCIAHSDTTFSIWSSDTILITSSCAGSSTVLEISNFTHVEVPKHCQLTSRYFVIQSTAASRINNTAASVSHRDLTGRPLALLQRHVAAPAPAAPRPAPTHHVILSLGSACAGGGAVLLLLLLAALSWRLIRKRRQEAAEEAPIADLKMADDVVTRESPPPYSYPAPATDTPQEVEEVSPGSRVLFTGLLELACEAGCAVPCPGSQWTRQMEQNFKHSLNLPLATEVTITRHPLLAAEDGTGLNLFSFHTRLHLPFTQADIVMISSLSIYSY